MPATLLRKPTSWLGSFFYGMSLPARAGFLILKNGKLLLWSAIPVLLAFALQAYLFVSIQDWTRRWIEQWIAQRGWDTGSWWVWLLLGLTKVLLFFASAFTFSVIAGIFFAPFN